MNCEKITIRQATTADVTFIATGVLDAVGIEAADADLLQGLESLCRRTDTLYSWRNVLVAEAGGKVTGMLVSYDGADYMTMRTITFDIVKQHSGTDFTGMDLETRPGEYYLDSLSVRPEFRRQGIGTTLLRAGIDRASSRGLSCVTLACEPHNTKARSLYERLGFRHAGQMFIFGEDYLRMELNIRR